MEKQEYQELKKLEKKHIKQKTAVEWKEADVAVSYVEENLQAMKERQDNYRQLVDSLTTDLTQMEFATQDALISQENHFVDQLNFMEIEISSGMLKLAHSTAE